MLHGISEDTETIVCSPRDAWDGPKQIEVVTLHIRADLAWSPQPTLVQVELDPNL